MVTLCPTKNLGPIGSAVLTFIGYKQTDKQTPTQTDKPNLYIDSGYIYICILFTFLELEQIEKMKQTLCLTTAVFQSKLYGHNIKKIIELLGI